MVLVGKSCPIKHCYTVMDLCTYKRTSHEFIVFINIEFSKLCLQCREMLSGLWCHQGCFLCDIIVWGDGPNRQHLAEHHKLRDKPKGLSLG